MFCPMLRSNTSVAAHPCFVARRDYARLGKNQRNLSMTKLSPLVLIAALAMPAWAADTPTEPAKEPVTVAPLATYADAQAAIDAMDYPAAARILAVLAGTDPTNPDVWNLFGFASRKMDRMGEASQAYNEALRLKPDHLGALEYQGEMFVDLKRPEDAAKNLATLKKLCGDCEEALDLEAYIAANPVTPS
jgi:predicted Zn-dependent protease